MLKSARAPLALALAIALTGCASGAIPGSLAGAPTAKAGNTFAGGTMEGVANNGAAASKPAASAAPRPSGAANNGKADTSGIGLGTFFDSYNFDFPIPPGQAIGAVANLSQAALAPKGGKVYLQVGLQTTDQLPKQRKPLNVSFVFDKSGSMEGEKIVYSRLAAENMVDSLGEQDLFSLVTFDTTVKTLIAPAFAVDKDAMKSRIAGIRTGSSTNIDGGLAEGYEHVEAGYDQAKINRVILMSDGEANVGITDAETLGERAAAFRAKDISLTTIGVGLGFKEAFMTHLATEGGGTFYFVNSNADAQNAFAGEIKTLQRVVASDVKLKIDLAEGVKLLKVFGHTTSTAGQSLNVDSSDLIAQQSKVLLLELEVPGGAEGGEETIANVQVDFEDVAFGGQKQAKAAAKVRFTADAKAQADSRDSQVASSVINLQTAAQMLLAAERLDGGDVAGARQALQEQHTLVANKADELDDQDLRDLQANLQRYLDRLGKDDTEVLKKELQFEAFQMQQGKKRASTAKATPKPTAAPTATPTPTAEASEEPAATPTPAPTATPAEG